MLRMAPLVAPFCLLMMIFETFYAFVVLAVACDSGARGWMAWSGGLGRDDNPLKGGMGISMRRREAGEDVRDMVYFSYLAVGLMCCCCRSGSFDDYLGGWREAFHGLRGRCGEVSGKFIHRIYLIHTVHLAF